MRRIKPPTFQELASASGRTEQNVLPAVVFFQSCIGRDGARAVFGKLGDYVNACGASFRLADGPVSLIPTEARGGGILWTLPQVCRRGAIG